MSSKRSAANTPGQRLRDLRNTFGVSQDLIAGLGGLNRIDVVRWEKDQSQGRSTRVVDGLKRAFGMTYEQFQSYMGGTMKLAEAISLAEPAIEKAKAQADAERTRDEVLADVFERANRDGTLLEATRAAAKVLFSRVGVDLPTPLMVRQVIELNVAMKKTIDGAERACRSDRSALK